MPISRQDAESDILEATNSELLRKSEGVRINNRNLDNVHPHDCQCPLHSPSYPEGNSSIEEEKRKDVLDYPE